VEVSEEMKELEWRLGVLREDRKDRERMLSTEVVSFEEVYNRQKNKYLQFRDRQKVKVSDPKYLDMIGSMQMRREKRRLDCMQKIERHFEDIDENIRNYA
jgi:hypothetical protein